MICIQCQDGAIFFPDEEIITPKAVASGHSPAIAFMSKSTGGMQFIKRYPSEEKRDKALQAIEAAMKAEKPAEEKRKIEEAFQARLTATEKELEEMRSLIKKETSKKPKKQKPKAGNRKKPKEPEKEFTPPTDEEIIAYIKERQMDAKLGQPAETIAEAFRDVYEKEEETGEKDENGFSIRRIVWRKANGDMVQDWKGCLRTFKGRQLMWHGDASAVKESGRQKVSKPNQFCDFNQNQYTDDEITDLENDLLNSSGA